MSSLTEVLWLGRGGQGAFTAARLLGLGTSLFGGRSALAFPSFGPERRGAPVFSYTKVGGAGQPHLVVEDRSAVTEAHWAVILDETLLKDFPPTFVRSGGILLVNSPRTAADLGLDPVTAKTLDAAGLAHRTVGRPWVNMALLGALGALSGLLPLEAGFQAIDREFSGDTAAKNRELYRAAHDLGEQL